MHDNTELGISSAKRATWRKADCRPLLQAIIEQNPGADDRTLFRMLWDEVKDDDDHLQSIVQYWFDLTLLALRRPTRRVAAVAAEPAQTVATPAAKADIKKRIEREVEVKFLTLPMPNGKHLADCTGADCRNFGGWFAAIAKVVPARQTVGDRLTQVELYRIWKANKR